MDKELNEKINLLNKISEKIGECENKEEYNDIIDLIILEIKEMPFEKIHPLIINSFANNICAKILLYSEQNIIGEKEKEIIDFLNDQGHLPIVYSKIFTLKNHLQSVLNESNSLRKREDFLSFSEMNNSLEKLFTKSNMVEKYIHKNFGYSLLDTSGQFIWCDSNSEKFFEIKTEELSSSNLFDLMIPYSKTHLYKKYGSMIFEDDNNKSKCFSYIIYSKNAMNKFLKCLKKLYLKNLSELRNRLDRMDGRNSIYHQYLKALSSRATVITLKFRKSDSEELICKNNKQISVINSDDFFDLDKPDDSEFVFKKAILLETRPSLNVPNIDFNKMDNDEKIVEFKNIIEIVI